MYTDYAGQIDKLTNDQAGALFKAVMHYAAGGDPVSLDPLSDMVFDFIRQHMDRDSAHYKRVCEKRSEARSKSRQMISNDNKCQQMLSNDGDNDNDNDNDNENDSDNDNEGRAALAALRPGSKPARKRKTKFNNFPERVYDIAALEKALIN